VTAARLREQASPFRPELVGHRCQHKRILNEEPGLNVVTQNAAVLPLGGQDLVVHIRPGGKSLRGLAQGVEQRGEVSDVGLRGASALDRFDGLVVSPDHDVRITAAVDVPVPVIGEVREATVQDHREPPDWTAVAPVAARARPDVAGPCVCGRGGPQQPPDRSDVTCSGLSISSW
jgi:hypothetical protein